MQPLTLDPPSSFSPSELVPEPAAVHALNILRALVRDARLAESVMPFLGHVFILSVNGFSSEHWAVSVCVTNVSGCVSGQRVCMHCVGGCVRTVGGRDQLVCSGWVLLQVFVGSWWMV